MEKGILETIAGAVAKAFEKGIGRKNLVTITAIITLATMVGAPLWLCIMVTGIAALAITSQYMLDRMEIKITGKDQPENNHGTETEGVKNEIFETPA